MKPPFIALITDFGEDDFFAASLKGVISQINPLARIIDITHRVPSFDIVTANFILFSSYKYFPLKTIFLVIVDPGVGSSRKILLVETKKYYFIAPDNGVLSYVLEEEDIEHQREITNSRFFLPESSQTFEGRDKMAPAAAWLSKGIPCAEFGPIVYSNKYFLGEKSQIKGNEIIGYVIYIDKFGNLISNIPGKSLNSLEEKTDRKKFVLHVGGKKIRSFMQNYSSVEKGELLFLVGSVGFIEVASREASASQKLKVKVGDRIQICVDSE